MTLTVTTSGFASYPPPAAPDESRLVFGYAPSVEGDRTRQALVDLCRAMSEAIGLDVAPMRVASYGALERAIVEGRANFGWFPPVVYAKLELAGNVTAVAQCVRGGKASYHACVIARDDSPIRTIEDIHDARAAWVD